MVPGDLQLVVGLGNPGDRYAGTRHNIGFMALDRLAAREQASFRLQSRLHGLLAEVGQGPQRLRLLKPQTFMNDSGRSIRAALDWFNLTPANCLVLVDDMDLPLGRLRAEAERVEEAKRVGDARQRLGEGHRVERRRRQPCATSAEAPARDPSSDWRGGSPQQGPRASAGGSGTLQG